MSGGRRGGGVAGTVLGRQKCFNKIVKKPFRCEEETDIPVVFAQEVVEMRSVSAQRVVGDHEVVFDKRKLKQPVRQKAHISHTFTRLAGGPRQPSYSKH